METGATCPRKQHAASDDRFGGGDVPAGPLHEPQEHDGRLQLHLVADSHHWLSDGLRKARSLVSLPESSPAFSSRG